MATHHLYRFHTYINHWLRAKSRFNVHSPFLHRFIEQVIRDKTDYPAYQEIESMRENLSRDRTWVKKTDLGAVKRGDSPIIQVGSEVEKIAVPKKYGQLIYRLALDLEPRYVLELGMGFGIATAYLLMGLNKREPSHKLLTMEGCPETLDISRKYLEEWFASHNSPNLEIFQGDFDDNLNEALAKFPGLDLVFMDGNHQKDALINYFDAILPSMHENGVMVIDDIYWSPNMQEGWQYLISHSAVTLSLDFHRMGMLFFNTDLSKENFKIRY